MKLEQRQQLIQSALELSRSILMIFVLSFVFRYIIFQPYVVEGASMMPGIHNNDYIWVDKISYKVHAPQRGDIVVLRYPLDESQNFIKRIIGLPGERVVISDGAVTIYNQQHPAGFSLSEQYLAAANMTGIFSAHPGEFVVPADQYFVLGDNRKASSDSREWGYLPANDIVGKAFIRLYPLTDFEVFSHMRYGV